MRLGKETGSLVNFMLANPNYVKPEVGMDVTECHWTDRDAWRVVEVDSDGKGCTLQKYAPKLKGDYYSQDYIYEDENGNPLLCNLFMHVRYKYKGWRYGGAKVNLRFNYRSQYEDPSF
jgi:hypothetical protein